jgi:guanosine-3',5'-bis(diphosphate) 3'-pyrophosphohydrolase
MSNMKKQAREFAIKRHGEQKYGEHPYFVHLDDVAKIASEYGDHATVVAYLHDVVEDTDTTLEEIESLFGTLTSQCVAILTDEPGSNRKERKSKTYAKMAKVSGELELALIVKTADRLANFRACVVQANQRLLTMYKNEHLLFKQSVYRPNLCEPLWKEIEGIVNT